MYPTGRYSRRLICLPFLRSLPSVQPTEPAPKPKPNWRSLRAEYESSGISLRNLAAKHGISISTTAQRSMREHWSQRGKLVAKAARQLESEVNSAIVQEVRDELAPWLEERKRIITREAVELSAIGTKRIRAIWEAESPADTKRESEAARTIETLVRVGRTALGMDTGTGLAGAVNVNILANQAAVQIAPNDPERLTDSQD